MESKHTPGPWTVTHPAISYMVHAGRIHVADAFAKVSTGISDKYVFEPEAEANARLIAAAPDLLDAAKLVEEAWAGNGDIAQAIDVCLLAIAKAEGEKT